MTSLNWYLLIALAMLSVLTALELRTLQWWAEVPRVTKAVKEYVRLTIRLRLGFLTFALIIVIYLFYKELPR
jgi:hypothetical protein